MRFRSLLLRNAADTAVAEASTPAAEHFTAAEILVDSPAEPEGSTGAASAHFTVEATTVFVATGFMDITDIPTTDLVTPDTDSVWASALVSVLIGDTPTIIGYGPWWNPYPYYDPYGSYYYPPYDYPDDRDYPRDDRYPRNHRDGCDYRDEDNHPCKSSNHNAPPKPSSTVPESSPEHNYVTANPTGNGYVYSVADYRPSASADPVDATAPVASKRQLIDPSTSQLPSGLRPAVRNVIQALRAMPPDARQRQLNSGRYHNFSPEELDFVIKATQP